MQSLRELVRIGIIELLAGLIWVGGPRLLGQTTTASILGTVTDHSGAVVPGAEVALLNEATGDLRATHSSSTGDYVFPSLEPGQFTVTVTMSGFRKDIRRGVVLQLNQRARVDFALTLGETTQEISVAGQVPLLNTDQAALGQVVEHRRVLDLPLNGRNFSQLAALIPGVLVGRGGGTKFFEREGAIQVYANGVGDLYNQITLDGVSAMENRKARMYFKPSIDAIQEFQVLTAVYPAEYGMNGGAQLHVALKSGTNSFHGSAFEFLRNDKLDARGYFRPAPLSKDILRRNQFGGVFSGPILRDRTFFLVDYEALRQAKQSASTAIVPALAMRAGDFSAIQTLLRDPLTNQPFPSNRIPADRIHSVYKRILSFVPLPNQTGVQNLAGTSDSHHNANQVFVRIDHKFNNKDRFFGRYAFSQQIYATIPLNRVFFTDSRLREQNVALNWIHVFSPTVLNEVRLGYQRTIVSTVNPRTGTDWDAERELGIKGIKTPSGQALDPNVHGFPTFQISGFLGLGDGGIGLGNLDETRQVVENLTLIRGTHTFKTGLDFRFLRCDIPGSNVPRARFNFTGEITGNAWADLVLGLPREAETAEGLPFPRLRGERYGGYFQDDWKVSRKLTLNLGLRYELFTVIRDIAGQSRTLRFDLPGGPQLWPAPGVVAKLHRGDHRTFLPRFGFAYRATDKMVVRGGYGMFQIANQFNTYNPASRNPPFSGSALFQNPLPPGAPAVDLSDPFAATPIVSAIRNLQVLDHNLTNGDTQQWSMNVGYQFTQSDMLEIGYVGSKGTHLVRSDYNANQPRPGPGPVQPRRPYPQFGRIRMMLSDFNSSYQALQVRFERRLSRGFTINAGYVWSHEIDEDYSAQDLVSAVPIGPQDTLNRRADRSHGAFDVRHRFTISFIWEIPFAKDSEGLLRMLFHGWSLNGITTLQTGFPFTILQSGDSQGADNGPGPDNPGQARPDLLPGAKAALSNPDPARWFNTDAFTRSTLHFGNIGRNFLFGPGTRNFDIGVFRDIPLHGKEGHRLQFRYEIFNTFNTPNFEPPGNTLGTGSFGRITTTLGDNRQMQFALKYLF